MFLLEDKTILEVSYPPSGVKGYLLSDALARKVRILYPDFKLIFDKSGNLSDVEPIAPPAPDITVLQQAKQAQNKKALALFLEQNPLLWQDGKYYGVCQEDQNEMSLNLMQYQLALSAGMEAELLWHSEKETCRVFSLEEYTALTLAVSAYITPYLRKQEQIKEAIFSAKTKEELEALEINYGVENIAE